MKILNKVKKNILNPMEKASDLFVSIKHSFNISWKASAFYFLARIFYSIYSAVHPIISLWLSKNLIDFLAKFAVAQGDFSSSDGRELFRNIGLLFGFMILGEILGKVMAVITNMHQELISNYIRVQMIKKTASLDISFFDSAKFYDDIMNARRDSSVLQNFVWLPVNIIQSIIQLTAATIILIQIHWVLPLAIGLLILPSMITEYKLQRYTYEWRRKRVTEQRKIGYIENILSGRSHAKEVRIFGIFDSMLEQYYKIWKKMFYELRNITIKRTTLTGAFSLFPYAIRISMYIYIGKNIIEGHMTIGDYTFYTGMVGQLMSSLKSFSNTISQFFQGYIKVKNYLGFLKTQSILLPTGDKKPESIIDIEFKNVSFKYPGTDKYVLNNISFKIKAKEKVAIVGYNGSGKSTIIKLMLRLYDANKGEILVNGRDIKEYDSKLLNKMFSVVFQDFANYAFSVRKSISISDIENIDDETRIHYACNASGVSDFLSKWKDGLDTYLTKQFSEDGKELSGGQWQKIALSRAFFKDANIVIMDEPTSTLDPEAEMKLYEKLNTLCLNKTTIYISHRLSSTTLADKILVLDKGQIVEVGCHQELMLSNGTYFYLFNLQAEKYISKNNIKKAVDF